PYGLGSVLAAVGERDAQGRVDVGALMAGCSELDARSASTTALAMSAMRSGPKVLLFLPPTAEGEVEARHFARRAGVSARRRRGRRLGVPRGRPRCRRRPRGAARRCRA